MRPWIAAEYLGALVCLSLGMMRPAVAQEPPAAPPTSYQLIDRALEAKRIDEETAYKYRVFAAFGDSRLPAAFRGAPIGPRPPQEVDRAGELLDTFSPATQAELAPFFMRPDEPGSWITLGTVSGQAAEPETPRPPGQDFGANERAAGRGTGALWLASLAAGRPAPRRPSPVQSGWQKFPAVGGKVKVWAQDRYPGDAAKARALANAMPRIWDSLTHLMQRVPVSDSNLPKNGGDGALDFYLVHSPLQHDSAGTPERAFAGRAKSAVRTNSCHQARYLLIDSRLPVMGSRRTAGILSTGAHELFHAIQFAFRATQSCDVAGAWIRESTATWAENLLFPAENTEHNWAEIFLSLPHKPIDSYAKKNHEYGAYLLSLYREKTGRSPDFMRTMWQNFETLSAAPLTQTPSTFTFEQRIRANIREVQIRTLKGVNDVLDKGFDDTWPRFLVKNWNQPPVDAPDGHRGWDRLTETPNVWGARQPIATPAGPTTTKIGLPFDEAGNRSIPYLSGVYTHFAFNANVRGIVFVNTIAAIAHQHRSVWGIQKIRGQWKDPEDWTKDFEKAWCRDQTTEDLEELVIVFGNSDYQRLEPLQVDNQPEIKAYPSGCAAWVGTSTLTTTVTSADPAITFVQTADARLRFEVDSALVRRGALPEHWKVVSGSITWRATVTGQCSGSASGVQAVRDMGPGEQMATLGIWEEGGRMHHTGATGPWPGDIPTVTITCPGQPPSTMPLSLALGWFNTDGQRDELARDGRSFTGAFTDSPAAGISTTVRYSFRIAP